MFGIWRLIDDDRTGAVDSARQERLGELIEHMVLDGSLDRTGTKLGVVTHMSQESTGIVGNLKRDVVLLHQVVASCQLDIDHLTDVLLGECLEVDNLVDTQNTQVRK